MAESVTKQAANAVARKDPAPRHSDGAAWGTQLKGRDPAKKYVFVSQTAIEMGIEFYEELGYVQETLREGGPRPAAGRTSKPGEFVTFRGHVLMSVDKQVASEIAINGSPGAGRGQREWDILERRILDKNRPDLLRNVPGRQFMHVANETTEG